MRKRNRALVVKPAARDWADMERDIARMGQPQGRGVRGLHHVSRRPSEADAMRRKLAGFLEEFKKTRVVLLPKIDATNLFSYFSRARLAIPADVSVLSDRYDFHLIRFGVNLQFAGRKPDEVVFTVGIDKDMAKEEDRSTAYSIFPKTRWRSVLTGQYTMAFDADFALSSPKQVPVDVEIRAASKLWLKTAEFIWSKCDIKALGEDSSELSWTFWHVEPMRKGGHLPTMAVLQVPKKRRSLLATAAVVASYRWPLWQKRLAGDERRYRVVLYSVKL